MNRDLQDPELLVSIDHIQKINVSELAGQSVRIEADPKHVRGGSAVRRDVAMLGWLRPPLTRPASSGSSRLFFPCPSTKPLRCSSVVYAAAEPGSRQSFTKAARSRARAAFLMAVGARPNLNQILANYSVATGLSR